MPPVPLDFWTRMTMDMWRMWFDAGQVVWLRSMRLAQGGALGERESRRMVSEKLAAPWELAMSLALDPRAYGKEAPQHVARRSVSLYGGKVRANRRRLSR